MRIHATRCSAHRRSSDQPAPEAPKEEAAAPATEETPAEEAPKTEEAAPAAEPVKET